MATKSNQNFGKYMNNKIETIQKNLDKEITRILIDLGDTTVEKVREFIQKEWYDVYDPQSYDRTYSLIKALRYTIKGKKVVIYFDKRYYITSQVKALAEQKWPPHRSFDSSIFDMEGLIDFMDSGVGHGGSPTNPRYNDIGIHFIDYAEKVVNEYLEEQAALKIDAIVKKSLGRR